MKTLKKILLTLLSITLVMGAALFAVSCDTQNHNGENESESSGETESDGSGETAESTLSEYKINLEDYFGNPMSDIVINLFKDGESCGMKVASGGVSEFKLDKGEYTFTLTAPSGDYYYDETKCILPEDGGEVTVALCKKAFDTEKLIAPSKVNEDQLPFDAFTVSEGAYYVLLANGDMTYFVYRPSRSGIYKFSVVSDTNVELGYYGGTVNVWDTSLADVVDNSFSLEIKDYNIGNTVETTTPYVIGVYSPDGAAGDCVLLVERTGDYVKGPDEMPWEIILPKEGSLKAYEAPEGATLKDLDLSDPSLTVVLSDSDGYYHLGDENGPVIMVKIDAENEYLASFKDICDTSRFGKYFYNEDGSFERKESYNEAVYEYLEICDENGVCPLDELMEYIIKNMGESKKWWDYTFEGNIFAGKPVPVQNAWLFACCYYE